VVSGGHWLKTCSDAFASLCERAVRAEIAKFAARGAKVVMTTEVCRRYLFARDDPATDCCNAICQGFGSWLWCGADESATPE
jgi:hypothetical protein